MVSVVNGSVIITDKNSGNRIIPRLSSAHNNYAGTDAVYQFLGDIQCQTEITTMMFSWGNLRRLYNHFPRVYYKDIIISLEEWILDVNSIKTNNKISHTLLIKWFSDNLVPQYIKLIDGDNELIIDIENKLSVQILIDEIKNRNIVYLRECLEIKELNNKKKIQFGNQIILPIFKYI